MLLLQTACPFKQFILFIIICIFISSVVKLMHTVLCYDKNFFVLYYIHVLIFAVFHFD